LFSNFCRVENICGKIAILPGIPNGIYLVAPYELIFQGLGNKKKFEKINEKLDTKNLL